MRVSIVVLAASLSALVLIGCSSGSGSAAGGERQIPVDPGSIDVFSAGANSVSVTRLAQGEEGAPSELLLYEAQGSDVYPVILFFHGFSSSIDDQEEMLTRLASHGFIVVSPQLYPAGNPNDAPTIDEEVALALAMLDWLQDGLSAAASSSANLSKTGIAGHSRGGKIGWHVSVDRPQQGLAGVDPVDGDQPPFSQERGNRITDEQRFFPFPVLVIGTGLGPTGGEAFACAPEGRNHEQYYASTGNAAFHVVMDDYGHNDMLDADHVPPCATNPDRGLVANSTAGLLIAYFLTQLSGVDAQEFLTNPSLAPIALTVESK